MPSTGELPGKRDELVEALRELSPMRWRRGPAHFEDPAGGMVQFVGSDSFIVLDGRRSEEYELPISAPELALDLAGVQGIPANALDFVRQWGLLERGPGQRDREPWSEWRTVDNYVQLAFAQSHLARHGSDDELEAFERGHLWINQDEGLERQLGPRAPGHDEFALRLTRATAALLAGESFGCWEHVVATGRGTFAISVKCSTLRARAFREAALVLSGPRAFRRCSAPDCRRLYVPDDPRQDYCEPTCRERAKKQRSTARKRVVATADHLG